MLDTVVISAKILTLILVGLYLYEDFRAVRKNPKSVYAWLHITASVLLAVLAMVSL